MGYPRKSLICLDDTPYCHVAARCVRGAWLWGHDTELQQAIDAAIDPYRVPVALAAYCGLRQAEVLVLQWEDIDWVRGTAEIRRTQRRGVFSAPKSKASRRIIELPPPLIEELARWRPICPKSNRNLVCPSVTGLPMQASALLQRGFYPALEQAGIRRVRDHDLRHSWASNLLEAGANLADVSRDLGHANVYITLKIYTHAIPKARRGTSDQMAALMAQRVKSGNKMETTGGEVEVLRSGDRAQALDMAERQGRHSAHPCASPCGRPSAVQNCFPAVLSNPGTPVRMLLEFQSR